MKSLLIGLALLITSVSIANADLISEDRFSTNMKIRLNKVKCTLFGNLKVKVTGLSRRAGTMANKWLRTAKTSELKCDDARNLFLAQVTSRNNNIQADVTVTKKITYRTVYVDNDRNIRPLNDFSVSYMQCEKSETKTMKANLPGIEIEGTEVTLSRRETRIVDVTFGPCRRM